MSIVPPIFLGGKPTPAKNPPTHPIVLGGQPTPADTSDLLAIFLNGRPTPPKSPVSPVFLPGQPTPAKSPTPPNPDGPKPVYYPTILHQNGNAPAAPSPPTQDLIMQWLRLFNTSPSQPNNPAAPSASTPDSIMQWLQEDNRSPAQQSSSNNNNNIFQRGSRSRDGNKSVKNRSGGHDKKGVGMKRKRYYFWKTMKWW
jgi:hypothetical protein